MKKSQSYIYLPSPYHYLAVENVLYSINQILIYCNYNFSFIFVQSMLRIFLCQDRTAVGWL